MEKIPIDGLSGAALRSTPREIDWSEAKGEDMDGWIFWEAYDAEVVTDDGTRYDLVLVSVDGSEATTAFLSDGTRIDLDDPELYFETLERACIHCGTQVTTSDGEIWVDAGNGDACSGNPQAVDVVRDDLVHEVTGVLTESLLADLDREPRGYAEGPMMSYWYPLDGADPKSVGPYGHDFDAVEAAYRLHRHSLCLVQVGDDMGLALTGGGMDFTWDIAAAFVDLGYLPPLHFCDLPAMAGSGPRKALPSGWRMDLDTDGPIDTRWSVINADGQVVERFQDSYAAERKYAVEHPASESDQRIIDAVTESLRSTLRQVQYRLDRHLERYVRLADDTVCEG